MIRFNSQVVSSVDIQRAPKPQVIENLRNGIDQVIRNSLIIPGSAGGDSKPGVSPATPTGGAINMLA